MKTTIKPIHANVIVKPATAEEVTASGIVLPDTINKERPEKGEVIAVGPGRILETGQVCAMNVKIGDQVIFKKYSPEEIEIDNETFLVIKESDILGIIEIK